MDYQGENAFSNPLQNSFLFEGSKNEGNRIWNADKAKINKNKMQVNLSEDFIEQG